MKYLVAIVAVGLAGCATPQQNAALAGAVLGAAVATSVSQPAPHPRPLRCYTQYIGYDAWHRPVYQQVCR